MSPNLFLASKQILSPHKWFARRQSEGTTRTLKHWTLPVPGIYERIPGRGWYLVSVDDEDSHGSIKLPQPVRHCKILDRYLFETEYISRRRFHRFKDGEEKLCAAWFLRLDDGVTWVMGWDELGISISGGLERWVVDKETSRLRPMLKEDDENLQSRRPSAVPSSSALLIGSSDNSSLKDEANVRRTSAAPSTTALSVKEDSLKVLSGVQICTCGSSRANSTYELPTHSSTAPLSMMDVSTAPTTPTTPGSRFDVSKDHEEFSAMELRLRLMELGNA